MEGVIKGIMERDDNGGFLVYINGEILSPKRSLKLRSHSPDGFSWGYGGSGPAQLALEILLRFISEEKALSMYQEFKWEVIAKLQGDFTLPFAEIERYISERG